MFICRDVCLSHVSVCLSVLSSITHERFDISSPNLAHICIESLVPAGNIDKKMGHETRSPGQKVGQIFK